MSDKTDVAGSGRRLWGGGPVGAVWARRLDHAADLAAATRARPGEAREVLASAWRAGRTAWRVLPGAPRVTR